MNNISPLNFRQNNSVTYFAGFLILMAYAGCFFFPLFDKDAAHHANIALNMIQRNDYASLIDRGEPYLDKPHLLFWSSVISFKIFGISAFAHRLPAFLFALLSLYSVYKLTRHLSNKTTANIALIILATAQSFNLSITDARMETPLTAGIALGLWQLIVFIDNRKFINIVLAALGAAIAFSTKGWIGVIIIFSAAFFYIFFNKKWRVLANPKTYLFVLFFALFISPVLYAYYLQFNLHPETTVRGVNNINGVKFILWDQNFERFSGSGIATEKRNSSYFFLWHTFMWSFFPWSIAAFIAVIYWLRNIIFKLKLSSLSFAAPAFAFILIIISFSKFKMAHYVIMLFPLATLYTAPYLEIALSKAKTLKAYYILHMFLAIAVIPAIILLNYYFFRPYSYFVWTAGSLIILLLAYIILKKYNNNAHKVLALGALTSIAFNFFLNYNFMPNLMYYQGGKHLAMAVKEYHPEIKNSNIFLLETSAHTFDFEMGYNHDVVKEPIIGKVDADRFFYVLTKKQKTAFQKQGYNVNTLISKVDYNVAKLKLNFLNPATRPKDYDSLMIATIYKP